MIIMRCKHVHGMGFDLGQFCGLSLMLKLKFLQEYIPLNKMLRNFTLFN